MNFCTPCHNDAMAGKIGTNMPSCTGGENCDLKIGRHPKADKDAKKSRFPLGCSLCRSEKMALIDANEKGPAFNLERRGSMI